MMLTKIFSKPIFRLSVVILVNENILRVTPVLGKDIKHRSYARWSSRKPSKVITPDEISSADINTEEFYKSDYSEETFKKKSPKKRIDQEDFFEKYDGQTQHYGEQDYVMLGENDLTFSKLMTLAGNRNMRKKNDLMMLEGKRLNADAIQAGLKPKKIFFTQRPMLEALNLPPNSKIPLFKIPYKTTKLWSKLDTPPGIFGFYPIPQEGDITTVDTVPVKVLCDNVRDPGNMGSIIRVAASAGCKEILLMKGCTDPWDGKVLRSASGGHFHIPIKMDLSWKEHEDFLQPFDQVFLADSNLDRQDSVYNLPKMLYHNVNYTMPNSVVVVIGGETEGLSSEAFKMAFKQNGTRVCIPMSNCMESLNSGCALSIVLFEVKRQFMMVSNSGRTKIQTESSRNSDEEQSVSSSSGG